MFNQFMRDTFLLAILLIVVVYFVGFSTDLLTGGKVAIGIINAETGRNAQGNFANYPR